MKREKKCIFHIARASVLSLSSRLSHIYANTDFGCTLDFWFKLQLRRMELENFYWRKIALADSREMIGRCLNIAD